MLFLPALRCYVGFLWGQQCAYRPANESWQFLLLLAQVECCLLAGGQFLLDHAMTQCAEQVVAVITHLGVQVGCFPSSKKFPQEEQKGPPGAA